jgi:cytoskeletal protein RodZ
MAKTNDPQDDDSLDRNKNNDSDDTFGLPEIHYEPIKRDEIQIEPESTSENSEQTSAQSKSEGDESAWDEGNIRAAEEPAEKAAEDSTQTEYYKSVYEEEESSIWPKVLGALGVVIVLLALVWYFVIYKPKQDEAAEKARIEAQQKAAAQKAREEEETRLRMERETAERQRLDSLANASKKPAAGSIETLNERTGRYYVVIASALDSDLLMDYAKKLSANGETCKIIPPYGKHKVSRISIAEGETFAAASAKAEELKATYGDALWVLKY